MRKKLSGVRFFEEIEKNERKDDFVQIMTVHKAKGLERDDVVVILHVDDVGMSHSSKQSAIMSLEEGAAISMAVMMPPPWVSEIAR